MFVKRKFLKYMFYRFGKIQFQIPNSKYNIFTWRKIWNLEFTIYEVISLFLCV